MSVEPGSLYLLPSDLGDAVVPVIPGASLAIAHRLSHFIAENPKSARAFLKRIAYPNVLSAVTITTLDKDTPVAAIAALPPQLLRSHRLRLRRRCATTTSTPVSRAPVNDASASRALVDDTNATIKSDE